MKLLTFNCWHGLSGPGLVTMKELESSSARAAREHRQLQELAGERADVYFLQELNPLMLRLPRLVQALGGTHKGIVQHDLTGVKILGLGFPTNLNSGLGIVAPSQSDLVKRDGIKLSGSDGFTSSVVSVEIAESRYALVGEVHFANKKVLLINAHLHHGLPLNLESLNKLDRFATQGTITEEQRTQIVEHLQASENRRRSEVEKICDVVTGLRDQVDDVIVAGDFNLEPNDPLMAMFENLGLIDVVKAFEPGLLTFDPAANPEIASANQLFDLDIPDFGFTEIKTLWREQNQLPRRLDYLLMTNALAQKVKTVSLWGKHEISSQNTSDHFGIKVELDID
jgi:endonuclease/exonuclease/phosphatase family metal-dependent hydrolase